MACVQGRMKLPLEIAVIFAIAAGVQFIPGGQNTLEAFWAALAAAFGIAIFLVCVMQYREHRVSIYSLGDARRALLYGTMAVLAVTIAAKDRMWQEAGGLGEFFWFAIVGLSIYTFVALYRFARRY